MLKTADKPLLALLEDHAYIRVSGTDAADFLQGQLSNDVREVSPEKSQLTSLNTPKGRTLALMRLLAFEDGLLLVLPRDLQEAIVQHLRKFVLRSKVEIEPCDQLVGLGIAGQSAEAVLNAADIATPSAVYQGSAQPQSEAVVIRVPGDTESRFEIHGTAAAIDTIRDKLAAAYQPSDAETWQLLDTLAGLPWLRPETSGEFVAQMLNLDELGAINFQKGCYPGQEVIARAHYRGEVKRRLKLFLRDRPSRPGETLTIDHANAAVVQSVPRSAGSYATLAVAKASNEK